MLVLSRKQTQAIKIGDEIEVCILEVRGGVVKLGVTAPPEVAVHRNEVYERIKRTTAPEEHVGSYV
jgi:carbon storage regulator